MNKLILNMLLSCGLGAGAMEIDPLDHDNNPGNSINSQENIDNKRKSEEEKTPSSKPPYLDEMDEDFGPINTLSDELLLHIFSFADDKSLFETIPATCRKWCVLSQDSFFWDQRLKVAFPHLGISESDKENKNSKRIYGTLTLSKIVKLVNNLRETIFKRNSFGNSESSIVFNYDKGCGYYHHEMPCASEGGFKINDVITKRCFDYLFSPEILYSLYGADYEALFHDLQAWTVYSDQFRQVLWMYRIVNDKFWQIIGCTPQQALTVKTELLNKLTNLQIIYDETADNKFKLRSIPQHILLLGPVLHKLHLENHAITQIPEELAVFSRLEDLVLDGNQITHVPICLLNLKGEIILSLQDNKIETLWEDCDAIIKKGPIDCCSLILRLNPLKRISRTVIENVTFLDAEWCELESLAEADYSGLQELYLLNNNLTTLPRSILQAERLENLDLTGNQFPLTGKLKEEDLSIIEDSNSKEKIKKLLKQLFEELETDGSHPNYH